MQLAHRRSRVHRHTQSFRQHPACGTQMRKHGPPGCDDDGAWRGGISRAFETGRSPVDHAGRLLRPRSTKRCRDQHRLLCGRDAALDYVKGEALRRRPQATWPPWKQIAKAMEEGALGLSSSLLMPPSNLITTGQLIDWRRLRNATADSIQHTYGMKARAFTGRRRGHQRLEGRPHSRRHHPSENRRPEVLGTNARDHLDDQ